MKIETKAQLQQEHTIHTKDAPGELAQVTRETEPLGLTGNLLHKATLLSLGDI